MAAELKGVSSSGTLYAVILDADGKIFNGTTFETYAGANYSTYDIPLVEQGNSNVYVGDFPAAITAPGIYDFFVYLQAGAAPAEGDIVITTGRVNRGGTTLSVGSAGAASGSEIRAVSPGGTLYARILNSSGQVFNGTAFEAYSASSYASYVIPMTELGNSNVYTVDFPTGIVSASTFEYFVHLQSGGAAAEGDLIINTAKIDWTGSASLQPAVGGMSGADFRDYILRRGFKRTDKDVEIFESTTDAIQMLRRRFSFDEAEVDASVSRLITTLGEFKMPTEANLGLLHGVILEDDDTAKPLIQRTKWQFDQLYPDIAVTNDNGYPRHFTLYGGQIYIGPVPDRITYSYRLTYSERAGTVIDTTPSVPFTDLYRDMLACAVLSQLYLDLEEFDRSAFFEQKFENKFSDVMRRERKNSGEGTFNMVPRAF